MILFRFYRRVFIDFWGRITKIPRVLLNAKLKNRIFKFYISIFVIESD